MGPGVALALGAGRLTAVGGYRAAQRAAIWLSMRHSGGWLARLWRAWWRGSSVARMARGMPAARGRFTAPIHDSLPLSICGPDCPPSSSWRRLILRPTHETVSLRITQPAHAFTASFQSLLNTTFVPQACCPSSRSWQRLIPDHSHIVNRIPTHYPQACCPSSRSWWRSCSRRGSSRWAGLLGRMFCSRL